MWAREVRISGPCSVAVSTTEWRAAGHSVCSPNKMRIRNYTPADTDALARVYRDAALVLGRQAYSDEQTRVWAMLTEDSERFRSDLSDGFTLCVVVRGAPVAFGQLNPVDHIAYLYCHSEHARQGYASAILARLEEFARGERVTTIRVEASCVSLPFFKYFGYLVTEKERVIRHGVEFLRYKMKKRLDGAL